MNDWISAQSNIRYSIGRNDAAEQQPKARVRCQSMRLRGAVALFALVSTYCIASGFLSR